MVRRTIDDIFRDVDSEMPPPHRGTRLRREFRTQERHSVLNAWSAGDEAAFGGLTEGEIGETLQISLATVKRDWEFGRSWLLKELG